MPLMIPSKLDPDLQRVLRDIDQELYWLRKNVGTGGGGGGGLTQYVQNPYVPPEVDNRLDRLTTLIDGAQGWEMIWSDNGTSTGILDFPPTSKMLLFDIAQDYYGTSPSYFARFRQSHVALGLFAMNAGTGGVSNTAVGTGTMMALTSGSNSVAIGSDALQNWSSGTANVAIGTQSLATDTQGSYNTAVGQNAGGQIATTTTSSRRNTLMGFDAGAQLGDNTQDNVAIGAQTLSGAAGAAKAGVKANIAIGVYCCQGLTTNASQMIGIGKRVHAAKSTGKGSVAIGHYSYRYNLTDVGNLGLGNFSGYNVRTPMNLLVGNQAGYGDAAYTSGVGYNYFIGASAGRLIKTAHHNIGIGYAVARNAKRTTYALYLGHDVGTKEMGGSYNFAIGYRSHYKKKQAVAAGVGASRPQRLMFLGHYAGYQAHGNGNMFLGFRAGYNASGPMNMAIGPKAGFNLFGEDNLALGEEVGYNAQTDRSILVGYRQGYSATGDDLFVLGNRQASPFLYGKMAGVKRLGIGQTHPLERLDLMSNASYGGIRIGQHESNPVKAGVMEFRNADAHFWGYDGNAWVRLDSAGGGGGGASGGVSISVNTHAASGGVVDFRDGTPAVPAGAVNVDWQMAASPSLVSAHVHFGEIVHASLMVRTRYSLTGGGNLMASRTLNLVNDKNAPGVNQTYGTNASGVRRWRSFPAGSGAAPNSAKYAVTALTASLGQEKVVTGRRGIAVSTSGASLIFRRQLPSKYAEFFTDFGHGDTADSWEWDRIATNTNSMMTSALVHYGHPGLALSDLITSAAAVGIYRTNVVSCALGGNKTRWSCESQIYIPTLSRAAQRFWTSFGFSDRTTNDTISGAALEFRLSDQPYGGHWQAHSSKHTSVPNASSNKDTGVHATSGVWYTLRIEVEATPVIGKFYIDDVFCATIRQNIPRGARPMGFGWCNWRKVGTTSRKIYCDYLYCGVEYTAGGRRPQ